MSDRPTIAYFSMEIGLAPDLPTYSGGLGVLAGDTVRAAADLGVPMVAVSLLYRKGYFYQRLLPDGWQTEEPVNWPVDDFLEEAPQRATIIIEGRKVHLRAWRYVARGLDGREAPVYLLDTDLPGNSEWDRTLTRSLYGGDERYRLCQEAVLGIGGVKMLRALGYEDIKRFHMNEGHAALLTLELLEEEAKRAGRKTFNGNDIERVRGRCVFTTHTPVPAGHDQFPMDLVFRVLGHRRELVDLKDSLSLELVSRAVSHGGDIRDFEDVFRPGNTLNITYLALDLSGFVNGVAKRHGEVSRLMFADYSIDAITNGVHAGTWTSEPFGGLYDRYIPGWQGDNFSLRYALGISAEEVWRAHMEAKTRLVEFVNRETNAGMDADVFTVGFARRAAAYKRGDLVFHDIDRLRSISSRVGPLQLVYSGKAHPRDNEGKELIKRIFRAREALGDDVKVAYLENYDMNLGKMITSGVDLWLNTPRPPLEASGTSGMKAALNGVPSLSVLDGWWIEGHIEGVTGWSIGEDSVGRESNGDSSVDALSMYGKFEEKIIPMFYGERERYIEVMKHAIALNGSFFNTQRMMHQYALKAYFL